MIQTREVSSSAPLTPLGVRPLTEVIQVRATQAPGVETSTKVFTFDIPAGVKEDNANVARRL